MVLDLIMPKIHEEITVKVIDLPYIRGEDVFAPVIMWGDPKRYRFEMKITKTIWYGIEKHLKSLEDDMFNLILDEKDKFKIDEDLSYLKDRIITIKGIPDTTRSFVTKNGKKEYPKIFNVEFRSDLEEAQTLGGDVYVGAVFEHVINNYLCKECRMVNTNLSRNDIIKRENKEKEKEEKKKEKTEKKIEKEVEWVKKKREKDEKESQKAKKMEDYWENL